MFFLIIIIESIFRREVACIFLQALIMATETSIKSEKVIMEIEAMMTSNSSWVLFMGNVIKQDTLAGFISELKQTIKEDFNDLNDISTLREQIILDAQQEADAIRQAARDEISQMEPIVAAELLAKQIIMDAKETANRTIEEGTSLRNDLIINAHKYCDNLFESIETQLSSQLSTLSENRAEFRSMLDSKIAKLENDSLPTV